MPLFRSFLVPFNASLGTSYGFIQNYGLVLIEEELVVEFIDRGHPTYNMMPFACEVGGVSHLQKFSRILASPHESHVFCRDLIIWIASHFSGMLNGLCGDYLMFV